MPYLYCEAHGRSREEEIAYCQEEYRQAVESLLVVSGRLISGPWRCDQCNAELRKGMAATLVSCFPGHWHDTLFDYDFGNERQYFAMSKADTARVYGAPWPDDSIRNRRISSRASREDAAPLCALDLFERSSI
jgi:hypothetical protein